MRLRIAGQVGGQRGELVEVDGRVRPDDPLVELLDGQPAFAEVLAELLDDLLTVLVARSHPGLEFPHRLCLLEVRHPMMRRTRRCRTEAQRRPGPTSCSTSARGRLVPGSAESDGGRRRRQVLLTLRRPRR